MFNKKIKTSTIIILLIFVVTYFPAFQVLIKKWSKSEDYAHAFLIVPIIIYIFWNKRTKLQTSEPRPYTGASLLGIVSIFYVVSLQLQIPTLISISVVLTIMALLISLAGFQAIKVSIVPILLMLMIIPLPNQIYSAITFPLQLQVTFVSEQLIRLFNISIFCEGNIISLPGKTFEVVGACSGMRSLISLTTLSLVIGYFQLRRWWLIAILIGISIPIAFLTNVVRVISMILAYNYFGFDLSEGLSHTLTGLVLFILALVVLFQIQLFMEKFDVTKE